MPLPDVLLEASDNQFSVLQYLEPSTPSVCACRALRSAANRYWSFRVSHDISLGIIAPIEPQPRGRDPFRVIRQWRNDEFGDWYCYWDDSYGMPADTKENYVFRPPLEVSKDGVVRTQEWNLNDLPPRVVYMTWCRILAVRRVLENSGDPSIGLGDESNGEWLPFMVPWSPNDGELTMQTLLVRLGAHPNLRTEAYLHSLTEDISDDGGVWMKFLVEHQAKGRAMVSFYTGSDKLNPVPVFAVTHVHPGLVAGFVGGIDHT